MTDTDNSDTVSISGNILRLIAKIIFKFCKENKKMTLSEWIEELFSAYKKET